MAFHFLITAPILLATLFQNMFWDNTTNGIGAVFKKWNVTPWQQIWQDSNTLPHWQDEKDPFHVETGHWSGPGDKSQFKQQHIIQLTIVVLSIFQDPSISTAGAHTYTHPHHIVDILSMKVANFHKIVCIFWWVLAIFHARNDWRINYLQQAGVWGVSCMMWSRAKVIPIICVMILQNVWLQIESNPCITYCGNNRQKYHWKCW